ncbi:acetyltransferase, GNAT family protein [Histomonas meleagridis]|nr:acetyltransferase, GNAT family protein [Histomonas meleagridis]
MNPSRWVGCIKDYDGITLVHCRLRSDIVYSKFPKILQKQIEILRSKTHFVHDLPNVTPSFVPFFQSPSFANFSLSSLPPSLFKAENYSERMKVLKEKLLRIFNTLASDNKFAEVFEHPVTEDFAPGYFSKIKKPMDFMTIRKRLTKYEDYYKRPEIFAADITLMCDNCKLFNTPDTSYYRLANELMKKFNHLYFEEFPQ